ncbi:MAG TPA: class 3 fructose-bisphosphatase, partial [Eubacteriaceae bacterium]|nr:class 3 fructose-bisphosphatase [Eubacteriaceae bacterium]
EYLELLSKDFPNISIASAEAINLTAILNLPKGTEHFLTDLHGEADAFHHVLQNASGVVKRKINDVFKDTLGPSDIAALASLIYYPELHLRARKKAGENSLDWQKSTIYQLVKICRDASSKYTRSKVRKALPGDYAYVIEELLHEDEERFNKKAYYYQIIDAIVDLDRGESFIKALCSVIKRLTIDHLHILGDVYDRGSGPHHIMEQLRKHHSLDIQWGNHDILWMGAAAGNQTCIANAVRISLRYSNLDVLEDGYGINLLPLATFAMKVYGNKAADSFRPKAGSGESSFDGDRTMITAMHQAITVIQLKLEHQIIQRHPEWHMQNRLFLHHINPDNGILSINGSEIPLTTDFFPTYNPDKPEQLTDEEEYVIEKLVSSFAVSEKLQQHVQFLYSKGSIYLTYNNNLLFHACIPMTEDGEFKKVTLYGKTLAGKALLDQMDQWARESFFKKDLAAPTHDFLWFLWCHNDSPLFGKDKMATFERYFLKDETTHEEQYAPYYHLIERE